MSFDTTSLLGQPFPAFSVAGPHAEEEERGKEGNVLFIFGGEMVDKREEGGWGR